MFLDYFESVGLPVETTAFDGRSDYDAFISVGIPAGGLFTGAEEIKTEEQQAIYGGTAGLPFDPCYHLACDTIDNLSQDALAELSDAAAHATLVFAMTKVSGAGHGQGQGARPRQVQGFEPPQVALYDGAGTVLAVPPPDARCR